MPRRHIAVVTGTISSFQNVRLTKQIHGSSDCLKPQSKSICLNLCFQIMQRERKAAINSVRLDYMQIDYFIAMSNLKKRINYVLTKKF